MIILGKKIAEEIQREVKKEVFKLKEKGIFPTLAVVFAGESEASRIFIKVKKKACEEVGIKFKLFKFPQPHEREILDFIKNLKDNKNIQGILVQLPLPKNLNENSVISSIAPEKDVDFLHPYNLGRLLRGEENIAPCTPMAIFKIFEKYNVKLEGKDVTVINHSNLIGKPLSLMLLNRNATVTVCHIFTKDLRKYTKNCDILITATGSPDLIKKDMVREGVVLIDCGISKISGKIYGDVEKGVEEKTALITPVPGGVGPVTVAMVLKNLLELTKIQEGFL